MSRTPGGPGRPTTGRVSLARNAAGLIWLILLLAVAALEFGANRGYNAAMGAVDAALAREDSGLLSQSEAERLIGKAPDGPLEDAGTEFRARYTWRGLLRSYTMVAYYTRQKPPHLLRLGEGQEPPPPPPG